MLFQIYGEIAGFRLLGWLMVFVAPIIKRSVEQKKNPYKKEIFTDTKDFQLALDRAEDK